MRTLICALLALFTMTVNAQQWNWAASAGGGGNVDFCHGIATDSQGNAYWVGTVSGDVDFGCATLSTGNSDILGFVAKRAPDGTRAIILRPNKRRRPVVNMPLTPAAEVIVANAPLSRRLILKPSRRRRGAPSTYPARSATTRPASGFAASCVATTCAGPR